MAVVTSAGAQQRGDEEPDPYLAAATSAAPPLAGLAPDLAEILRRRRDKALDRREAERAMRELKRARARPPTSAGLASSTPRRPA